MNPQKQKFLTLRGYGAFKKIILNGQVIENKPVKAFYCVTKSDNAIIKFGYAVTKRAKTAVFRNRIKRLMREAIHINKNVFNQINSKTAVEIVFMYYGKTEIAPKMVRFVSIAKPISEICIVLKNVLMDNK